MAVEICPKCQSRVTDDACPRCGLLVKNFATYQPPSDPILDEKFRVLEQTWDDVAAHGKFLEFAKQVDALDLAAHHYREVLKARPHDTHAQEGLRRTTALTTQLLAISSQNVGEDRFGRGLQLAGRIFAALLLVAVCYVLYRVISSH